MYSIKTHTILIEQIPEDIQVGHVVGTVSGSDRSDTDNLISNLGLHVTYTISSLAPEMLDGTFDIDRNTGSLVVARPLDRERKSEYRLEIRALDTTATNNPQSSAVTVKVEISDVNDNAPRWATDPIIINVMESSPIGSILYNFSATDTDAGPNGDVQYNLLKQMPGGKTIFAVDPLTGTLTQLLAIDYEELNEYMLVVQAVDQALNESERLSASVTARIIVMDVNDNPPVFVSPSADDSVLIINEQTTVGHLVAHVVAIDKDSGDNSRVSYSIVSGNDDDCFKINTNTGHIELIKPLANNNSNEMHHYYSNDMINTGKYFLVISASDHGRPIPLERRINLQIVVQGTSTHQPRFTEPVYHVNISESIPMGNFVIRVHAKSFQSDWGRSFIAFAIQFNASTIRVDCCTNS